MVRIEDPLHCCGLATFSMPKGQRHKQTAEVAAAEAQPRHSPRIAAAKKKQQEEADAKAIAELATAEQKAVQMSMEESLKPAPVKAVQPVVANQTRRQLVQEEGRRRFPAHHDFIMPLFLTTPTKPEPRAMLSERDVTAVPEYSPTPKMDIIHTPKGILFALDCPGCAKGDISVVVQRGVLQITGEKRYSHSLDREDLDAHIERSYGRFHREIVLPLNVDTDKILARLEDGVLLVDVQRSASKEAAPVADVNVPINKPGA